jgi:hypothetical protein
VVLYPHNKSSLIDPFFAFVGAEPLGGVLILVAVAAF